MPSELCLVAREENDDNKVALISSSAPYRFGRSDSCNYIIRRNSVAAHQFTLSYLDGVWFIEDPGSPKGTWLNGEKLREKHPTPLEQGAVIGVNKKSEDKYSLTYTISSIKDADSSVHHGMGEVVRLGNGEKPSMRQVDVKQKRRVLIGRGDDCTIIVNSDRVSRHHCEIVYENGSYILNDLRSTNGTYVNGGMVTHLKLGDRATINVPTQVFAFENGIIRYHARTVGIAVELAGVTKTVPDRDTKKPLNITNKVSMYIPPNSFTALVGGSGCGKSSLLTCINGLAPCTGGKVYFDKLDMKINRHAFDATVGNVPQKDILHENLTIWQSLMFMAKLRIAGDLDKENMEKAVRHAIEAVDLTGKEQTMIANLSGGQKKRVSIAMELLANPRLLILDEPTSGLSPDLDRSVMELLRRLSRNNCTVIVVTHNMDNINLCDRIAFLGKGGNLCYYGPPEYLKPFFNTELISDIFVQVGDKELVAGYVKEYMSGPEFNRVAQDYPEILQEVEV